MSEGTDTFWVTLLERLMGFLLIIIGGIMIYFTATSADTLKAFTPFFGVISAVLLIVGIFLLLVKPTE
jgi:hypothetical protein